MKIWRYVGGGIVPAFLTAALALVILGENVAAFYPSPASSSRFDPAPNRLIIKVTPETVNGHGKSIALDIAGLKEKFGFPGPANIRPLIDSSATIPAGSGAPAGMVHPGSQVFLVDFPDGLNLDSVIFQTAALPWVEYVEYDRLMQLYDAPDDPLYQWQWGLSNTGQTIPVVDRYPGPFNDTLIWVETNPGFDVDFAAIHDHPGPHSTIIVGILDTGSDLLHEDLIDNLWHNPGEIPDNGIDDDHNGYIDDYFGYDFSGNETHLPNEVIPDPDPTDYLGHGTHVAGIVAAVTDNALGIAGLAERTKIMTLKIFPNAHYSIAARAIYYGADNGVDVFNMSFGSPFASRAISEALAYARARGVLPVAASGNDGIETDNYPSADISVLTVGAFDYEGQVAHFSTYGEFLDLVAPGESILSLRAAGTDLYAEGGEPDVHVIAEDYLLADGTSMATPHVTGCAAALLSIESGLSPDRLTEVLKNSCVDILDPYGFGDSFPGWDKYSGHGLVNLGRAINELAGVTLRIETPHEGEILAQTVIIEGTADGPAFTEYQLDYGSGAAPQSWTTLAQSTTPLTHAVLYSWNTAGLTGIYTLQLRAPTGHEDRTTITLANTAITSITSPQPGDTISLTQAVFGSAVAPDFLYSSVFYAPEDDPGDTTFVWSGTKSIVDNLICTWSIDAATEGWHYLILVTATESGVLSDSVLVYVNNPYHEGWPAYFNAYAFFTPAVANLDNLPNMEFIVPTANGLYVFDEDGTVAAGWPRDTMGNYGTIPAIADLDGDHLNDIVIASENYLHIYTFMGEPYAGWPKEFAGVTGLYGLTVPLICDLEQNNDAHGGPWEILAIDLGGTIRAFHDDGTEIEFENADYPLIVDVQQTNGGSLPRASVIDISNPDGSYRDGQNELIVAADGLWIWNAETGAPFPGEGFSPQIRDYRSTHGMAIGDFDGDDAELEIAVCYRPPESNIWHIDVLTADGASLPGWPISTGLSSQKYLMNPLAAGDVDGDGLPEIFLTSYFIGEGFVMAYRADGSSLLPENPDGVFLHLSGSSSPVVLTDVTGDGLPEIVFKVGEFFYGHEYLYALTPDGEFIPGYPLRFGFGMGTQLAAPLTTDLDGDGYLNMLTLESTGRVAAAWDFAAEYKNNGHPWPKFRGDNWNSGVLTVFPPAGGLVMHMMNMINYIFRSGPDLPPYYQTDMDCNGRITILDMVILVNYIFRNGPKPCTP